MSLLKIDNLSVSFRNNDNILEAVKNISFEISPGETLALVGESGSGKSVTAHSILKLLPYPKAFHPSGSILFENKEILTMSENEIIAIRGNKIGMVFQEPMTSLNPLHKIEKQISETLFLHTGISKAKARDKVIELLDAVGIIEPEKRLNAFPHELSGGQRQRVMIAMAIANNPSLLIADEPTTALDVTVQKQVLELLKSLQQKLNMAVLLISHDLGVVKNYSDNVIIMKKGEMVETGKTEEIFKNPQHSYTKTLINAGKNSKPAKIFDKNSEIILKAKNIKVYFPIRKGILKKTLSYIKAVDSVSFELRKGTSLGVVGESGSGKTTLALSILRLIQSEGVIKYKDKNINDLPEKLIRPLRKKIQVVFQDPYGSLSPRMSILQIIEEGLLIHYNLTKSEREQKVIEILEEVGINPGSRHRYPHEFSGGQRQRISIARALILKPDLIILDEPTSALDRTIQFQIIDLLKKLQEKYQLSYLFISHDLSVIKALCHKIIVMKDGKIVEFGDIENIYKNPSKEYTKNLISSAFDL
jgi:microcin C transport system ATP-binding protein